MFSQGILGSRFYKNKPRLMAFTFLGAMLFSIVAPVGIAAAQTDVAATNNDQTVSNTEVGQTLQSVSGVLASSDQVVTTSDADSAVTSTTAGSLVDVPKDASEGVTFGAESGPKLDIQLPSADQSGDAQKVAEGVVAYDAGNGSANAVQATEDGGVRMLAVIDNPDAPTAYDYKVTVPGGGKIELTVAGGAVILDAAGQVIAQVDTPWAKDANQAAVETWFTTDGKTLTQHVKHNVPGVVYPVTADPRVSRSWHGITLYLSRWETNLVAWSTSAAGAYFGWTGFGGLLAWGAAPAAQWATSHGYCLAIYKSHFQWYVVPWAYRC